MLQHQSNQNHFQASKFDRIRTSTPAFQWSSFYLRDKIGFKVSFGNGSFLCNLNLNSNFVKKFKSTNLENCTRDIEGVFPPRQIHRIQACHLKRHHTGPKVLFLLSYCSKLPLPASFAVQSDHSCLLHDSCSLNWNFWLNWSFIFSSNG